MSAKELVSINYEELRSLLGRSQMGEQASDHVAELSGYYGWNYVAITALAKQAARSLVYVYDDSKRPEEKQIRKSLRLQQGANWRKSYTRESHGEVLLPDHSLCKLLMRPNPHQSGGSFRYEQVLQLHLHGTCIVVNWPNERRNRTVERYVVPMALIEPIRPGFSKGLPNGGIRVKPTNNSMTVAKEDPWNDFSPIRRLTNLLIPYENLTVYRFPHAALRGEGASPTMASSMWIDTARILDLTRNAFYQKGPNGQIIIHLEGEVSPTQVNETERRLNDMLGPDGPGVVCLSNGSTVASQRTAEEMGHKEAFDQFQRAILSAHHVSRSMIGDVEGMTYGSLSASLAGSILLAVQPDMDLIADEDTIRLAPEYEGNLSIEYEVPTIDDPELKSRLLNQDAQLGVMTVGEYRRKRGDPPFGDWRDDMMLTSKGMVDPEKYKPKPKGEKPAGAAGGGDGSNPFGDFDFSQFNFSHKSPVRKSAMAMTTTDFEPLVSVEYSGTICDRNGKIDKSCSEVIGLLKDCGFRIGVCSTNPDMVDEIESTMFDAGIDIDGVNLPEVAAVWDRMAMGCDTDNRWDDLHGILDLLPDCDARRKLKEKISANLNRHEFGFVGFNLPDAVADMVREVGNSIDPFHLASRGVESEPHVTLIYGLTTSDVAEVSDAVRRMDAPTIVLGGVSTFPCGDHGVPLKIDVESRSLQELNLKIKSMFPHVTTHPTYRPHVTIAYLKPEFASMYSGQSIALTGMAVELDTASVRLVGKMPCTVPLRRVIPEVQEAVEISDENGEEDFLRESIPEMFKALRSKTVDQESIVKTVIESLDQRIGDLTKGLESAILKHLQTIQKEYRESDHPRDDDGKFAKKEEIAQAAADSGYKEQFLSRFTDPQQRAAVEAKIAQAGGDAGASSPAQEPTHPAAPKQEAPAAPQPPSVPSFSDSRPKLAASLKQTENQIRNIRGKESAYIHDENGTVIGEAHGNDASTITFDKETLGKIRGSVITHNHPDGWEHDESSPKSKGRGFSTPDLAMAVMHGAAEIRAVSRGYDHSLTIPHDFVEKNFDQAMSTFSPETQETFKQNISEGKSSKAEAVWYGLVTPAAAKATESVMADVKAKYQGKKPTQQDIDRETNDLPHNVATKLAQQFGWNYSRKEAGGSSVTKSFGFQSDEWQIEQLMKSTSVEDKQGEKITEDTARSAANSVAAAAKLLARAQDKHVGAVATMLGEAGMPKEEVAKAKEESEKFRLFKAERNKDGKVVSVNGKKAPEHIQKMKIPPAWTNVWINPSPDAVLVATGVDEKGRRQSIYSAAHSRQASAKKFAKIKKLSKKIGTVSRKMQRDARKGNDTAAAAYLIYKMGLRPGSDTDTKAEHQAYGATTLRDEHVFRKNGKVFLKFVGKKGVHIELEVKEDFVAEMLMSRKHTASKRGGRLFDTDVSKVNKYIDEVAGEEINAKDFRTAKGTMEAKKAMEGIKRPTDEKELRRAMNEVGDRVAAVLGNTRAIALASYVDPSVFSKWEAGIK